MPFDWFSKSAATESVAELIDKKKYRKALQKLRAEFDQGNRSVSLRLQCAEVLEQTGKPREAVPILLGVAGELKNAGERERALEVLDKALSLEPTRRDIVNAIRSLEEPAAAARPPVRRRSVRRLRQGRGFLAGAPVRDARRARGRRGEACRSHPPWSSTVDPRRTRPAPAGAGARAPDRGLHRGRSSRSSARPTSSSTASACRPRRRWPRPWPRPRPPCSRTTGRRATTGSGPTSWWPSSTGEFSIADVAEMAVAEGQSDKEALVGYVQELATRFPCAEGARPGPSQVAGALFSDRHEEALNELVSGLRRHDFDPGQAIVTEGEHGRSLFILARGRARVLATSAHGKAYEVAELEEGQVFGDLSLEGRPRSATVLAMGACETLEIAPETFEILSLSRPRAAEAIEGTLQVFARSPERAAVKSVPAMPESMPEVALALLDAHLGPKSWNARARMRLAELVAKAAAWNDAVPVLVGLADEMQASGQPARALAILRKIDAIKARDPQEMRLTMLQRTSAAARAGAGEEITTYVTVGSRRRPWRQERPSGAGCGT